MSLGSLRQLTTSRSCWSWRRNGARRGTSGASVAVTPSEGEGFALASHRFGSIFLRRRVPDTLRSPVRAGAPGRFGGGHSGLHRHGAAVGGFGMASPARDGYTAFPDTVRKWCCPIPCLGVISMFCWSWQPNDVRVVRDAFRNEEKENKRDEKDSDQRPERRRSIGCDAGNRQRPGRRTNRRGCDDHDGHRPGTYTVEWETQGGCDPTMRDAVTSNATDGATGSFSRTVAVAAGTLPTECDGRRPRMGEIAEFAVVTASHCSYTWEASFVSGLPGDEGTRCITCCSTGIRDRSPDGVTPSVS